VPRHRILASPRRLAANSRELPGCSGPAAMKSPRCLHTRTNHAKHRHPRRAQRVHSSNVVTIRWLMMQIAATSPLQGNRMADLCAAVRDVGSPQETDLAVIRYDAEGPLRQVDAGHRLREYLCAKARALLPELLCQLAAQDALRKARAACAVRTSKPAHILVRKHGRRGLTEALKSGGYGGDNMDGGAQVFDVRCRRQLTARGNAIGEPALKQERLEFCTSSVDSSCMRGGSRADNTDLGVEFVC